MPEVVVPFGREVALRLGLVDDLKKGDVKSFSDKVYDYIYDWLERRYGRDKTALMWFEDALDVYVGDIVKELGKMMLRGKVPKGIILPVRRGRGGRDIDAVEEAGGGRMRRSKRSFSEGYEEFKETIELLADVIKDAVDSVVVAVGNVEDLKELEVASAEDILYGLKKRVAGALDVLVSAVEELLDVFEYDVEEDETIEDSEGVFDEVEFEVEGEDEDLEDEEEELLEEPSPEEVETEETEVEEEEERLA